MQFELTEDVNKLLIDYSTKVNRPPQDILNEIVKLSLTVEPRQENITGNFPSIQLQLIQNLSLKDLNL